MDFHLKRTARLFFFCSTAKGGGFAEHFSAILKRSVEKVLRSITVGRLRACLGFLLPAVRWRGFFFVFFSRLQGSDAGLFSSPISAEMISNFAH